MRRLARSPISLLLAGCALASGCVQRERLNSDCKWIGDPPAALDLADSAQQRHLNQDVMHAEELAIRYGDARARRHRPLREGCMAVLTKTIAERHQVPLPEVLAARGRRDERWDAAVVLTFAMFYALAACRLIRWIGPRFADRHGLAIIWVVALSLPTSAIGVLVGDLWSRLMESARFGWTGHISERAFRIPWRHHYEELFAAGVFLFWLIAVVHHMTAQSNPQTPWRTRT